MNIVKQLRLKKHLSQAKLAKKVGVTDVTIRCWEKRIHQPDMHNLLKLAKALKVKPDKIIDGLREERLKNND